MKRRAFIAALGSAAAWPVVARAQQSDRMRRIGVLMGFPESDPEAQAYIAAFREGLPGRLEPPGSPTPRSRVESLL